MPVATKHKHAKGGAMQQIPSDAARVIIRKNEGLGNLSLNRPTALHALNLEMVELLTQALLAWRDDSDVTVIMLDHAGPRGFCAGGDIAMLAASGAKDSADARAFFLAEYRLNHLIFSYPKPIVAIIDGITMGGGVGLSVHAPFRIATERTTFAMPETGIGLFPDVGGGWFLPRLKGQIGIWLALTGTRLKAADAIVAGVATHFVPSELLGAVKAQIAGASGTHDPSATLRSGFAALEEEAGPPRELTDDALRQIETCFRSDKVEQIFEALEATGTDWASAQLATLKTKSPQTLKVALRQMRAGEKMATFGDNMAMEYRVGARVISLHDFQEGVRAVIIDKDHTPKWQPDTLAGVTDALLEEIFAPLPQDQEWRPLL
jgi:enoyl-CoA hydratase